jgi:large subunit ribosomal protein L1
MAKAKKNDETEELNKEVAAEAQEEMQEEIVEAQETDAEVAADEAEAVEATKDDSELDTSAKVTKAGPKSQKALNEAEAETERKEAAKLKAAQPVKAKQLQKVNPLKRHGKIYRSALELVDREKLYSLAEAIALAKATSKVKFDASLELHMNLGVDPKQADQMVRASVVLPSGTGKSIKIAVVAPEAKQAEAKKAGADTVGGDELIAKIEKGFLDFDMLISTPDFMPKLGKLAKVLGPKGLMPNPKSGSVTTDVARAVSEAKGGKVEFRIDKQAILHQAFGRVSFADTDLLANVSALVNAVMKAKPASAKGTYVTSMSIASSMGPGIKLDITEAIAATNVR